MNKILYFLIPIGMAWALLSNSGGAAAVQNVDRTSSPLGVGSCGSCHSGGNYSPVISVELLDNNAVVNKYSAGKLYQVKVSIAAGNNPRGYGFQLVSLSGNNNIQGGIFGNAPAGFNKKGVKIAHIPLNARWTANVCFGGYDKSTLFITSMDGLYTLDMNVKGL